MPGMKWCSVETFKTSLACTDKDKTTSSYALLPKKEKKNRCKQVYSWVLQKAFHILKKNTKNNNPILLTQNSMAFLAYLYLHLTFVMYLQFNNGSAYTVCLPQHVNLSTLQRWLEKKRKNILYQRVKVPWWTNPGRFKFIQRQSRCTNGQVDGSAAC